MQGLLPSSSRNFRVSLPPNGQRRPGTEKAHILLYQVQHFSAHLRNSGIPKPHWFGVLLIILLTRAPNPIFLKVSDLFFFYRLQNGLPQLHHLKLTPGTGSQSLHIRNKATMQWGMIDSNLMRGIAWTRASTQLTQKYLPCGKCLAYVPLFLNFSLSHKGFIAVSRQ